MEKKTLRFSFMVFVVFCLFSVWTVAQGETESGRQIAQTDVEQETSGVTDKQPPVEVQVGADGMVSVPAGEFWMGCNETADSECEEDEKPYQKVNVPGFRIDRTEVTVEAYRQCFNAKQCSVPDTKGRGSCNWDRAGYEKHPINCIDWNQAEAFCAWAGKRLPTSAEWEKAARGTDGRVYPSGNTWDITQGNVYESYDGYKDTAPVGSFPAGVSPYGALDMAGNVWEWTADWFRNGETRMIRGGSWVDLERRARTSRRLGTVPISRLDDLGVRCAQ